MSISLNNHESRIKALENSGSQNWTRGESSTGIWWKDSKSGLLLQHSKGNMSNWGKITLPKSYSSTTSFCVVANHGNRTSAWTPTKSSGTCGVVSTDTIVVYSAERVTFNWITIGYLISNSIRSLLGGGLGWL